jgi:hypothetical protein
LCSPTLGIKTVELEYEFVVYKSEHRDKYWKRLLTRECVERASLVDFAGIWRHQNFCSMADLRMVDVLIAMKRAFAVECLGLSLAVECPGLSLGVVDMLKSCSDYLSDLSLVTDCRRFVAGGFP